MAKMRKSTTKTDTGQSNAKNGKSTNENPYSNVELENLSKNQMNTANLKKSNDLPTTIQ